MATTTSALSNSNYGTVSVLGLNPQKYSIIRGGYSSHACSPGCTERPTCRGNKNWFDALQGNINSNGTSGLLNGVNENIAIGINALNGWQTIAGGQNNISIGAITGLNNVAIGNCSFVGGGFSNTASGGYSNCGHCCKHKDCKETTWCSGFKDRKWGMITEKYIAPTFTDEYGTKKWVNRYGDIVKTEIKEPTQGTITGGYSTTIRGGYNISIGTSSLAVGCFNASAGSFSSVMGTSTLSGVTII